MDGRPHSGALPPLLFPPLCRPRPFNFPDFPDSPSPSLSSLLPFISLDHLIYFKPYFLLSSPFLIIFLLLFPSHHCFLSLFLFYLPSFLYFLLLLSVSYSPLLLSLSLLPSPPYLAPLSVLSLTPPLSLYSNNMIFFFFPFFSLFTFFNLSRSFTNPPYSPLPS